MGMRRMRQLDLCKATLSVSCFLSSSRRASDESDERVGGGVGAGSGAKKPTMGGCGQSAPMRKAKI